MSHPPGWSIDGAVPAVRLVGHHRFRGHYDER